MPGGWLVYAANAISWMVLRALRRALDLRTIAVPLEIVLADLEQVRGDLLGLGLDLARGHRAGGAGRRGRAARVGAEAVRRGVGVALLDLDVARRKPSSSATICAYVVSWPWPCDFVPKRAIALPVGWMRISAESNILIPRMS